MQEENWQPNHNKDSIKEDIYKAALLTNTDVKALTKTLGIRMQRCMGKIRHHTKGDLSPYSGKVSHTVRNLIQKIHYTGTFQKKNHVIIPIGAKEH